MMFGKEEGKKKRRREKKKSSRRRTNSELFNLEDPYSQRDAASSRVAGTARCGRENSQKTVPHDALVIPGGWASTYFFKGHATLGDQSCTQCTSMKRCLLFLEEKVLRTASCTRKPHTLPLWLLGKDARRCWFFFFFCSFTTCSIGATDLRHKHTFTHTMHSRGLCEKKKRCNLSAMIGSRNS